MGEQTVNSSVLKIFLVQMLHNMLISCLLFQVIEDNTGVRRVVVTPQSPECYPPSYPSAISPTHHLPPYLTHHPHFIHNSHTAFYPPVTGPGDMPPQFFPQHHLPPTIYGEQGELDRRYWYCSINWRTCRVALSTWMEPCLTSRAGDCSHQECSNTG